MAKQSAIPKNLSGKGEAQAFFKGLPTNKLTPEALEKEYTIRLNGFQLNLLKKSVLSVIRNTPELQAYDALQEAYKLRQVLEGANQVVV